MTDHSPQRPSQVFVRLLTLAGLMLAGLAAIGSGRAQEAPSNRGLFDRDNLVAWCIVPFDAKKRGPEERAAMLRRLGFRRFAYDWRAEHIPTFDAELDALKRQGVALEAFWVAPGELNRESRLILDVLKRHEAKADLWALLDLGPDLVNGAEQERRVERAASMLRPLAEEAKKIGCSVALYNHGGWFGEPENQLAIIDRLKGQGVENVGIVYNLHHGHAHVDRLAALLKEMMPHLRSININGMDRDGDRVGRKILPLGQGELDLQVLRIIRDSGYRGPIGILGHTMDDAEARLRDNLDGLDWLVPQLDGKPAGPKPTPRTPVPPRPDAKADGFDPERVTALVAEAEQHGDPMRGGLVFLDAKFACSSCHKVGPRGGSVGPELSAVGTSMTPAQIVEAVLWPRRQVKEGYDALAVACQDGRIVQGYRVEESDPALVLREAATGERVSIPRAEIDEIKTLGTLMPDGLAEAMTPDQRRDLIRFLTGLGRPEGHAAAMDHAAHSPAAFKFDRAPLDPSLWPSWRDRVNRDRIYDFYAKEAEYFAHRPTVPRLLPPFPGLDGGTLGHWGNQDEKSWSDGRWNRADLGSVHSGIFRGAGVTVPKGVCVRLGDRGELAACFNPETLRYEAVWKDGFVKFSDHRHGFLDGLLMDGTPVPVPAGSKPDRPFVYRGFYRHGNRVIFAYRVGDVEMLDAPWAEDGHFTRVVAPASAHPMAGLTHGGPARWPQTITTKGKLGDARPYAVDTIEPPFENPWNAPLFFGDHDFLPDGMAMIATMQGDVWRVDGIDESLKAVRWRRFATGLHQPLGLVVADGRAHVLGRDQITRLHDLNNDGEADFYECVSNAYITSPAGHDFICGLQRDEEGRFYTVSGKQGLLRISADGKSIEVLATGFRNPDGLGRADDGTITVPNSEGEWVPASMICAVRPGGHYGYMGPKEGRTPDLPLVYLPRGLDNSSGAQVSIDGDRWGPLRGQMVHLSFGAGAAFLLLRESVEGRPQGAVTPIAGEFRSGVHRGRFNPKDGQLYVSGMTGWGTYTTDDGCFQRVRYTGDPVQLPTAFHARQNGVLVTFSAPIDSATAEQPRSHFAQVWNYRYGPAYGSPEFSTRHPGTPGHDPLFIRSSHVLDDGRTLFLEIPDLQPVNQLHLHMRIDPGPQRDLYATVHALGSPFTDFPGYRPVAKTIAAHPILSDLATAAHSSPNPWRKRLPDARPIAIEAGTNLTFTTPTLAARAGEPIALTFANPDVVPHNWALLRPGTLAKVGDLANKLIAEPDAAARQYIPRSDDVLAHTDVVPPGERSTIYFRAPSAPGRYPFLCTFPGHWMVMNGVLVVQ